MEKKFVLILFLSFLFLSAVSATTTLNTSNKPGFRISSIFFQPKPGDGLDCYRLTAEGLFNMSKNTPIGKNDIYQNKQDRIQTVENQLEPINEALGLGFDLSSFKALAECHNTDLPVGNPKSPRWSCEGREELENLCKANYTTHRGGGRMPSGAYLPCDQLALSDSEARKEYILSNKIKFDELGAIYSNYLFMALGVDVVREGLLAAEYTIFRGGKLLEERTTYVQEGDLVIITPKLAGAYPENLQEQTGTTPPQRIGDTMTFTPNVPKHGYDWITTGGYGDTPPVEVLDAKTLVSLLNEQIIPKRNARYPCNATTDFFGSYNLKACRAPVPVWEPEISDFDETLTTYAGPFGYPAYVIPLNNGQKMGLQVFCALHTAVTNVKNRWDQQTPKCSSLESGGLSCEITAGNSQGIESNEIKNYRMEIHTVCYYFIDKIIRNGKAVQADLLGRTDHIQIGSLKDQLTVIQAGHSPPNADFECQPVEEDGQLFIDCKSNSFDPDGTIEKYCWQNRCSSGGSRWKWQEENTRLRVNGHGRYSVTLKVTDNEDYSIEKTKIIDTNPSQFKTLTADYKNGMARIGLECAEGQQNATIDIQNAITEQYVLEKSTIPCNQTTLIGPITTPDAYIATVTLGEEKQGTKFTITT